jgi:anti-sigma B factor antagonist
MQEFHLETVGPSGDCAVLRVTGEVDVYTAPVLRERIHDLAAKGAVHIIADLSRVDFLDSTGLGVLVGGLKRVREDGGSLTPVITSTCVLHILQITGLTRVLPPQPSVPAAIDADPHWQETVHREAGGTRPWCREHGLLRDSSSTESPGAICPHGQHLSRPSQDRRVYAESFGFAETFGCDST